MNSRILLWERIRIGISQNRGFLMVIESHTAGIVSPKQYEFWYNVHVKEGIQTSKGKKYKF